MSWSSIFADIIKIVEEVAPFESLLPTEAATIAGAVGTIVTTLANKAASAPVTTTTKTVTTAAAA
jgi:hypothetical protein